MDRSDSCEVLQREWRSVLQSFRDHASSKAAFEAARRNLVYEQGFPPDGHFVHLADLESISVESEVEHRTGVICSVEYTLEEGRHSFSNIRFGTRHIRGPAYLLVAMKFIRDHRRFRVADVPGRDERSRLVLVRRLIREGLLRRADPLST